jgi:beta-glucosidase
MKMTRRHWFFSVLALFFAGICGGGAIVWHRLSRTGVGEPRRRTPQWMPRHDSLTQLLKTNAYDVVFFGDSIVQQWESTGRNVWEATFAPLNSLNADFGGDHTRNLLWHLRNGFLDGKPAIQLAVVLIGTNDIRLFAKQTAANIRASLDEIQTRKPGTKILLLGIFPRGEAPGNSLREVNARINAAISKFADNRRIFYRDLGPAFLTPDGVLKKEFSGDFVHLTEAGYHAWADALLPDIKKLLAAPETPADGVGAERFKPQVAPRK